MKSSPVRSAGATSIAPPPTTVTLVAIHAVPQSTIARAHPSIPLFHLHARLRPERSLCPQTGSGATASSLPLQANPFCSRRSATVFQIISGRKGQVRVARILDPPMGPDPHCRQRQEQRPTTYSGRCAEENRGQVRHCGGLHQSTPGCPQPKRAPNRQTQPPPSSG